MRRLIQNEVWCGFVVIVAAAILFGPPRSAQAELMGYWNFDSDSTGTGGIDDLSSGNHDGSTVGNGVVFSPDFPPNIGSGNSLSLDGTDDYVTIDQNGGYKGVLGTGPRTLTAWIKMDDGAATGTIAVWGGAGGNGSAFGLKVKSAADDLQIQVSSGYANGVADVMDGTWRHVAVVVPVVANVKTNDVLFYVDGSVVSMTFLSQIINTVSNLDVRIGVSPSGTDDFKGLIDDVAIWDEVLTTLQIASLADGTKTPLTVVPEPGSTILLLTAVFGLVSLRRSRRRRS